MPRIKMSEKCVRCLEKRRFIDDMCSIDCTEHIALTKLWDFCHDCNRYKDCKLDPRECIFRVHLNEGE
jgi:hypothetical protein